ncbi:MAG: FAD-dependent oxidoreductase [Bacteroidia bacterium]
MEEKKYCIIGAGLVGSLLSVILAQRGLHVDVWERRPDLRGVELQGGRSINLALSTRGLKALQTIGLAEDVRKLCIPMHGRAVHNEKGEVSLFPYGKTGEYINSVSRGGLNQMLIRKADENKNINLHFDEKCEDVNYPTGEVTFQNIHSKKDTKKKYDVIFGTDGAFSAARLSLMKTERLDFAYTQDYIEHAYKELTIPAGKNNTWQIEKNALHIWPRKSFMMIALPNLDGSFTCTLFLSYEKGEENFSKLKTEEDVTDFFKKYFPDALPLMPTLLEDFFSNPTASLATMRCSPWNYKGKGLLVGDAAHPIVPFYGQGMNAGFEDCSILNGMIDKYAMDWEKIFQKFSTERKPDADAVADLALQNFIEMRDLVADPHFQLKNKIDKKMAELFPEKWNTQYALVSFTHTPYSVAQKTGRSHSEILEKIVSQYPDIETKLASPEAKEILAPFTA